MSMGSQTCPGGADKLNQECLIREWSVSAFNESYLTEYRTDFHVGFFAAKVIHVAMIQDTWDILFTKYNQ